MIKKILKRDGRTALYSIHKITEAIFKAAQSVEIEDQALISELAKYVEVEILQMTKDIPTVEEIQDIVEKVLIERGQDKIAKSYILYRKERTNIREMNTRLMKTYQQITFNTAKEDDSKRENANIDADTAMGTMLKYGSEGAKEFNEKFVLNPQHAKAHHEGDIHIHDLDFLTLTLTCCQIDIVKLFKNGFSTGHGFIREPQNIESYSALACIAIQANQNDMHGGQSIPNFDYGMADGIRKTYHKKFVLNFLKAFDLLSESSMEEELIRNIFKEIEYQHQMIPTLEQSSDYFTLLSEKFHFINPEIFQKILHFALKNAEVETNKATYQAMESFIHNMNTMHSRAGAQVPFSSINYGTDTSLEGRMVIENLLLATEKGLGEGETAIFPIQIFKVKDGINFNPGESNYDLFQLACRVSAKRMFPNFSFIDAPFNLKYYQPGNYHSEISYMGCRTRVIGNVYDQEKEIVSGRGNLSFTTINLPRIAILANHDIKKFYQEYESKISLIFDQLMERFYIQSKKKMRNFPFLMGQGVWLDSDQLNEDDEIKEIIKHGTLTIGFIGLAECLKALLGVHHGESAEAQKLGLEIISFLREKSDKKAKETGLNFSVIATPAEGLSGRFIKIDKDRFGIIPGVTDREYYTNSFHIPVYYPISVFKKIALEAPYHDLTNAGHITYVEFDGSPLNNLEAFEKIVRYMKSQGIGYGSINHPLDRDPICGYNGVIDNECPKCHRTEENYPFERIRRITGYLVGTLDRFNNAKKSEEKDRVKHGLK